MYKRPTCTGTNAWCPEVICRSTSPHGATSRKRCRKKLAMPAQQDTQDQSQQNRRKLDVEKSFAVTGIFSKGGGVIHGSGAVRFFMSIYNISSRAAERFLDFKCLYGTSADLQWGILYI